MIVRDEEQTLARAINCVLPFADQIVIVDTGSRDDTKNIARSFTGEVYDFEWCDDFSAARNFSFSKATCDYIMWLDADDVITEENAKQILQLKERDDFDVAFLKYAAAIDGDTPTFVYYRERIFRRSLNLQWQGEVHEVISPKGKCIYSEACVFHKKVKSNPTARNLRIYQSRISKGLPLDDRQKFYYGRELYFNGMYVECIAVLDDYLSGGGWVENKVEACRTLYKAYLALGHVDRAVSSLLQAFAISYPRAEDCCALAAHFEKLSDTRSAIYWYKAALNSSESAKDGGFVNVDFLGFIPAIRLCVLYDRLGEYQTAAHYNDLAGKFKPNDQSFLHNKSYFKNKLS